MGERRRSSPLLQQQKSRSATAIAPFSRLAAAALDAPRFQAVLDAYGDATLAVADAAHVFAASQSAEAAEALSDAALAYRDSLLAISAAGDESKRRALAGELH
jgi:hypothetical protein